VLNGETTHLEKGDLAVVPSWVEWSLQAETQFDLFNFGDQSIIERLSLNRTYTEGTDQ
jgi:gentisate 1,2-dioxygenase